MHQKYPSCKKYTETHQKFLNYNKKKYKEIYTPLYNTLQIFITNKCNLRCKGCFYQHKLGLKEMDIETYKKHILKYLKEIKKVIILGGEPTLYKNLPKVIKFNNQHKLKTTVYTNGINLKILEGIDKKDLRNTTIRIGVYGLKNSEKPIIQIKKTNVSITIVYMLRKDNIQELLPTANFAEKNLNCKKFYISSIRDITQTQDYWKDTKETLNIKEYFQEVQKFIKNYKGKMDLHIAKRGIIKTNNPITVKKCRFGNIFPDNKKIICPFDISRKMYTKELIFYKRACNKFKECILTKLVLKNMAK